MNKDYPFFAWVFTLLIGPFLWIMFEVMYNGEKMGSMFQVFPVCFMMGLFLSLPVLFITVLVFMFFQNTKVSKFNIKLSLMILGVLGVLITFKLMGGFLSIPLTIFYSVATVISYIISNSKLDKLNSSEKIQQYDSLANN